MLPLGQSTIMLSDLLFISYLLAFLGNHISALDTFIENSPVAGVGCWADG
jgi:hypothetical protein